jgi:hypothetical protein
LSEAEAATPDDDDDNEDTGIAKPKETTEFMAKLSTNAVARRTPTIEHIAVLINGKPLYLPLKDLGAFNIKFEYKTEYTYQNLI